MKLLVPATRRVGVCVALAALAVGGSAAAAGAHSAQPAKKKPKPPTIITVLYAVTGTSHLAKPGSDVSLGPATLTTMLNPKTDAFTGSLPLPPAATTFKILGLLPVSATASFIPVGGLTGQLTETTPTTVVAAASSSYILQLSDVTVAGIPTPVGSTCETTSPVQISVATPSGQSFNALFGGTLTGSYTVPDFVNCGQTTALINQLVPGPGNTVSLTLGSAQIQHPSGT